MTRGNGGKYLEKIVNHLNEMAELSFDSGFKTDMVIWFIIKAAFSHSHKDRETKILSNILHKYSQDILERNYNDMANIRGEA